MKVVHLAFDMDPREHYAKLLAIETIDGKKLDIGKWKVDEDGCVILELRVFDRAFDSSDCDIATPKRSDPISQIPDPEPDEPDFCCAREFMRDSDLDGWQDLIPCGSCPPVVINLPAPEPEKWVPPLPLLAATNAIFRREEPEVNPEVLAYDPRWGKP